jgi:predicted phosphate transport protein (TIGR00153 family)
MNNSFLSRFSPKEGKFFPLLKQMSTVLIDASQLMIECLKDKDQQDALQYYHKIKGKEHEGDILSQKIFDELNTTFITPFDREDIHNLANTLDDVTDRINSCVKRIALYNPKTIPQSAVNLARLIYDASVCISKAIDELDVLKKNADNVKKYCIELHSIENQADDVYEDFVMKLFNEEEDGIEIMKEKEIMYELEKATDSAEHVGKIIKTIIVKYA